MLTAKVASGPANGTVALSANGSFVYTPNAGFAGSDSFTYTANDVDTTRSSNVATVSITVRSLLAYTLVLSPLKTPAQQGSAVPIIWQLKDATGKLILSLSTLLKIESVYNGPVPPTGGCVASATGFSATSKEMLFSLPNGATGASSFRLVSSSSSYQFNWDTTTTSTAPTITGKGCYTILLYFNDRPDLTNPRMTSAVQLK